MTSNPYSAGMDDTMCYNPIKIFKIKQISEVAEAVIYLQNLELKKPCYFEELISRYSCFICFAILAAAAEGGYFSEIKGIKSAILGSVHKQEIKKAYFENITFKSKITIYLLKKEQIRLAFYFLYLCKKVKDIRGLIK